MPFENGANIGPYRIIEKLGQGGMATVYKAYHAALDRYVAIKALHPAFLEDPNFLARFQREARVVAKLEHPNIVPIYDFSEHGGQPFLVMKYISGETLKARLSRGQLAQPETSRIVKAVGDALEYAHDQGILHRDVKPSNVLLAEDGRIFLTDFGLARIAQAGESTLSSDVLLGTPQYISPEQARGQRELDNGTDIYSFGVLLYELVVGRVPFSADTPFSIIHDHIYTPLPLPRTINPAVPEALERVLLKALAKERADRFADVDQMVAAYEEAIKLDDVVRQARSAQTLVAAGQFEGVAHPENPENGFTPDGGVEPDEDEAPGLEAAAVVAEAPKKKKRRRWLIPLGVILVLCVCSVLLLGVLNANQKQQNAAGVGASLTPTELVLPAATPPKPRPPLSDVPDDMRQAIEEARTRVVDNPQDPYTHLELAMLYHDAGKDDEAQLAFDQAVRRGWDSFEFLWDASNILMGQELWSEAARLLIRAVNLAPSPTPPDLVDQLREALYLGADDTRLLDFAPDLPDNRDKPQLMDVVIARHALYQGDMGQAEQILRDLRQQPRQIPEIDLLEAEILINQGQPDPAMEILNNLDNNPEVPMWIREVARFILNELQKNP